MIIYCKGIDVTPTTINDFVQMDSALSRIPYSNRKFYKKTTAINQITNMYVNMNGSLKTLYKGYNAEENDSGISLKQVSSGSTGSVSGMFFYSKLDIKKSSSDKLIKNISLTVSGAGTASSPLEGKSTSTFVDGTTETLSKNFTGTKVCSIAVLIKITDL